MEFTRENEYCVMDMRDWPHSISEDAPNGAATSEPRAERSDGTSRSAALGNRNTPKNCPEGALQDICVNDGCFVSPFQGIWRRVCVIPRAALRSALG